MIYHKEFFNRNHDGVYSYSAVFDALITGRSFYVQAVVKEIGGPRNQFKLSEFAYQTIKAPTNNACDKIMSVQETSDIKDMVLLNVEGLAKRTRPLVSREIKVVPMATQQ